MNFYRIITFAIFAMLHFCEGFSSEKVLLLNDTTCWFHWGCTGTSTALKEKIKSLGYELTAIPISETTNVEAPQAEDFNNPLAFYEFEKSYSDLITQIKETDSVIINGEGTLHIQNKRACGLLYLAYIAKTRFQKNVQIINHSVYPEDYLPAGSSQATSLYQMVYEKLDFIAVREKRSFEMLKKMGIGATQSFDCLPLFICNHCVKGKKTSSYTIVFAGGSSLSVNNIHPLLNYLDEMKREGYRIVFLTGAKAYPAKDEQEIVALLLDQKKPYTIVEAASIEEWLDVINQADLLVSGRFHHSIAAAFLQTPFIAFDGNTPKIVAMTEMFDLEKTLRIDEEDLFYKLLTLTKKILSDPKSAVVPTAILEKIMELTSHNFDGLHRKSNVKDLISFRFKHKTFCSATLIEK